MTHEELQDKVMMDTYLELIAEEVAENELEELALQEQQELQAKLELENE